MANTQLSPEAMGSEFADIYPASDSLLAHDQNRGHVLYSVEGLDVMGGGT